MSRSLLGTLLVAAGLGFGGIHPATAKAVDKFAEFKGAFKGTASFVISSPPSPGFTGKGTITATGPKSGASMKIVFKGAVSNGASPTPYQSVFTFKRSGAFTVSDGVFGLFPGAQLPFRGKAKVGKLSINGKGSFLIDTTVENARVSIKSKTAGRKQTITVDYVISNSFGSFPFKFVASRKIKK